jgi:hypothetical protein
MLLCGMLQACGLFMFPTKALAQDQLRVLRQLMADAFGADAPCVEVCYPATEYEKLEILSHPCWQLPRCQCDCAAFMHMARSRAAAAARLVCWLVHCLAVTAPQ